ARSRLLRGHRHHPLGRLLRCPVRPHRCAALARGACCRRLRPRRRALLDRRPRSGARAVVRACRLRGGGARRGRRRARQWPGRRRQRRGLPGPAAAVRALVLRGLPAGPGRLPRRVGVRRTL
ncbi:MAG: hypothetical protein AVDCRST_MAG53-2452, partial [uncultured Solirubrobacteraceae bacterium]